MSFFAKNFKKTTNLNSHISVLKTVRFWKNLVQKKMKIFIFNFHRFVDLATD